MLEHVSVYIGVWLGREEEPGADWLVLIETPWPPTTTSYLEVVRTGELVRLGTVETQVERSPVQLLETPGEHRGVRAELGGGEDDLYLLEPIRLEATQE